MTQDRPKGLKSLIFSRTFVIVLLILFQVVSLAITTKILQQYAFYIYSLFKILSAIVVIYLSNRGGNADLTFTWMLLVLIFPVFGTIFYIYVQTEIGYRKLRNELKKLHYFSSSNMEENSDVKKDLGKANAHEAMFANYMYNINSYPVYETEEVQYFPLGEDKFEKLKTELLQATKYIFMEYFIVAPGTMLNELLDILELKANRGVDVRFLYDGMNAITTVPANFKDDLKQRGINAKEMMPVAPIISTTQNNRDHRKICVIDGKVAFTGGINLADEYINKKNRFGHWKDTAIMFTGSAVNTFTMLFLKMWNVGEPIYDDFSYYFTSNKTSNKMTKGFIIPYGDSPYDGEDIGKNVYTHIINAATKYVHIMTPYLVIDKEFIHTLTQSAKSGVDVRIIMPGIPDKYYVFALAKTYYGELIKAGVKIYEYRPGFVHAKVCVSDQERATVGTVNLDYRSFYHHFECGTYLYRSQEIYKIEDDFNKTLTHCHKVTMYDLRKRNIFMKLIGWTLKLVAPLM